MKYPGMVVVSYVAMTNLPLKEYYIQKKLYRQSELVL
jgi:hypothetical protein